MTQQNPHPSERPVVLGGARNAQHVPLEDRQRQEQSLRQWQDQQAGSLKRVAGRARVRNVIVTAFGSFLILAFLWVQIQGGRVDSPSLILIPAVLAVILVALAAILPPSREVSQVLRQYKKNRRAERKDRG